METSISRKRKEWERNRKSTYLGSSRHFFKSLVTGKTKKNWFTILPRTNAIDESHDTLSVQNLYPSTWKRIINNYSIFKVSGIEISVGYRARLNLITNKYDENQFSSFTVNGTNNLLIINTEGILYDPLSVEFNGKWGHERFARHLPLSYRP